MYISCSLKNYNPNIWLLKIDGRGHCLCSLADLLMGLVHVYQLLEYTAHSVHYCELGICRPLKEHPHLKCDICSSKHMLQHFCLIILCNGCCICLLICLLICSTVLSYIFYVVCWYLFQDVYWWIKLYVHSVLSCIFYVVCLMFCLRYILNYWGMNVYVHIIKNYPDNTLTLTWGVFDTQTGKLLYISCIIVLFCLHSSDDNLLSGLIFLGR
jgi:hypothetical protein